jgi:hypothetical protein
MLPPFRKVRERMGHPAPLLEEDASEISHRAPYSHPFVKHANKDGRPEVSASICVLSIGIL